MKYYILVLLISVPLCLIYSQHNIELKEGLFYTNYFRSDQTNQNSFWGWGNKTEVTYKYDLLAKKNNLAIGMGYANFNFLDESFVFALENGTSTSRSCLTFLLDYRLKLFEGFSFSSALKNYVVLHPLNEFGIHKKLFINLDIGLNVNLNKKVSIILSSPISIQPMYSGSVGLAGSGPYKVTGEQIGIDLGINYKFGK